VTRGWTGPTNPQAIENERTRLLATLLNNVAGSLVTTGLLTPVAGYFLGTARVDLWTLLVVSLVVLGIAALVHGEARRTLGRLQV
jgi:hypothetical protein